MSIGVDPQMACPHSNTFKWECPSCYGLLRDALLKIAAMDSEEFGRRALPGEFRDIAHRALAGGRP